MNIAECLRSPVMKKIFELLLQSHVISTQSISSNLAFTQPTLLKFLFHNKNIKIISKIVNLKKEKLQFSYICLCNVFLRNPVVLQRSAFLKSVLSSCSQNTGPISRSHIKSSQERNKIPLQL